MNSIKNEIIEIKVLNTKRKVVFETVYKNRILNNALDWLIYKQFPDNKADVLFPKFAIGGTKTNILYQKAYMKFDTTQVITDTSTTMNFDIKDEGTRFSYLNGVESGGDQASISEIYEFEITAAYDGSEITSIGFGLLDTTYTDYLMAWVDLSLFNITVLEGFIVQVQRKDKFTTLSENDKGSSTYLAQAKNVIENISFGYRKDFIDVTYDIQSLTTVVNGIGEVKVTGFGLFDSNQIGGLYPSLTTFPSSTTYPSGFEQYNYCIIDFVTQPDFSPSDFTMFIKIKDLDVSFDNKTIEIKYKYERGA